ncbi:MULTISPECIES: hypothetical protein [unclassified Aerococcus]|uniref:hypothetical protein n=1 Tax=unclassified Aerococcus TaxID=2618060 RepID=UPI0025C5ECFD|nr:MULTISPECIES: hypothetical protein [unclassified Aerococcus]
MERTLTTKEKMNIKLLLLAYILLIVFSAVWLTNAQGQPFAIGDTMQVMTVMATTLTIIIGIILAGVITHFFVELAKPNKNVSTSFTFSFYIVYLCWLSILSVRFFRKKSAIKFDVMIIPVQPVLHFVFEALANLFANQTRFVNDLESNQ